MMSNLPPASAKANPDNPVSGDNQERKAMKVIFTFNDETLNLADYMIAWIFLFQNKILLTNLTQLGLSPQPYSVSSGTAGF